MRIRILWLILLTMAVTALPVSARSVARVQRDQKTDAAKCASDRNGEQATPNKKDEQPKIQVAPSVDLWDGGSTRTLSGNAGSICIPTLLGYDAGVRVAPVESWPHAPTINRLLPEHEQHCWLTCRYAHAPPLIG